MTIRIEKNVQDGVHIFEISGTLTDEAKLVDHVRETLAGEVTGLVFDLGEVDMITSSGLADLVQIKARCNSLNLPMLLARPTAFVVGVLETTKLAGFFDVHEKIGDAVAAAKAS